MDHTTRCPSRDNDDLDGGFSLIEVSIGMIVIGIAIAMFIGSANAGFRASASNRAQQQATSLAGSRIELARSLDWSALAMSSVEEGAPFLIDDEFIDGSALSLDSDEPLVVGAPGAVAPHTVEVVGADTFEIWTLISVAAEADGLRRVVVVVEWSIGQDQNRHIASTLISQVGA